jgi:hypothetical protein
MAGEGIVVDSFIHVVTEIATHVLVGLNHSVWDSELALMDFATKESSALGRGRCLTLLCGLYD